MGSQSNKAAAIFDAAVELKSPTERAAYLDGACGCNAQLRIQVEELLAHDDAAGSFLESPTLVNPPVGDGGVGPGLVIGPYKLLEQIGEGGMGAVFMAEQTHPVHRKVALKIIRAGMDSRRIVARFEAERQALALMDHPNIAKVLDGGTVGEQGPRESGTLAGRPPRSHLAANGAGVAPARPYFVMELVKGIAIIKYCDENRLTPRQRLELFIPICQAVQHAHQKGIIHRDLKPSNVMVCQYDGKPVPKIIDFGIAKATGQKLTEHTLFTEFGSVVGTLEYMSPEQAEMNQLDIDTRSDIYSLGVLLYELLTGTTPLERGRLKEAAFLEVLRLIREEEPPRPSTRLSTQEALPSIAANRGLEPAKLGGIVRGELDWIVMKCLEKDRSRRYETANGLARDLERYLADEPVQACPPSTRYRLRKFARRNKRALVTAGLLAGTMVLAVALLSVSYLRLKVEQARTASEYHRAEAQKLVAEQQRGEAELQKGIADQQRREAEDRLGLVFEALDEVFVKEGEARELLRNRPTERQAMDPQREKAEREFTERGLRFYEKLAAKPGTSPAAQAEMASAFRRVGRIQNGLRRPKEAEHAFRESLELVEKLINQFPETWEYKLEKADTLQWLVVPIADSGRNAEADELTRQALKIIHGLPPELRDGDKARRWTARCHRRLGKSLAASGRIAEAIPELLEGERCLEQLAIDFPNEPYANGVAESRMTRAICLADSGRLDEAVAVYAAAAAMYEKLIAESATGSDDNAWYRRELGYCCNLRGGKLRVLGRLAEAEAVLSQGTKIYQKLVSEFPVNETNKSRLTWNETELGQLYKDRGQHGEAEKAYLDGVAVMEKEGLSDRFIGGAYEHLSVLYREQGKIPEAIRFSLKWVGAWETLVSKGGDLDSRRHLAYACRALGSLYQQDGNHSSASAAYRKSIPLWEALLREAPSDDLLKHLHITYGLVIDLPLDERDAADWKPVIDDLARSVESRKGGDAYDQFFLIIARAQLGQPQDAQRAYDQAVQWAAKNDPQSPELQRLREEAEEVLKKSSASRKQQPG